MSEHPIADLGHFVVLFQNVEASVYQIIVETIGGDEEYTEILLSQLGFTQRLNAAEVVVARFLSLRESSRAGLREIFHELMVEIAKLAQRRNALVHSNYSHLITNGGSVGLVRTNSRLRPKEGTRDLKSEDILPLSLQEDHHRLLHVDARLERFRQGFWKSNTNS